MFKLVFFIFLAFIFILVFQLGWNGFIVPVFGLKMLTPYMAICGSVLLLVPLACIFFICYFVYHCPNCCPDVIINCDDENCPEHSQGEK